MEMPEGWDLHIGCNGEMILKRDRIIVMSFLSITELASAYALLRDDYETLIDEKAAVIKDVRALQTLVNELRDEKDKLAAALGRLAADYAEVLCTNEMLLEDKRCLTQDIYALQSIIDTLRDEKGKLRDEKMELADELVSLQTHYAEARRDNWELRIAVAVAEDATATMRAKLRTAENENKGLVQELALEREQDAKDEGLMAMQAKTIDSLHRHNDVLRERVVDLRKKYDELIEENRKSGLKE